MERNNLKKAIIFDCDDTLWEGIIGEGPVFPYEDMQHEIVMYVMHGVIIGLCSKNEERDVISQLSKQPLSEKYISVKRVNWKDKASNLKEIASELNIGLDAIVFVDDSDFEIELIRKELPEVLAIYPKQLSETVIKWFDLTGDLTKTQQYRENYQRTKAKEEFTDINDYLASLNMVLKIKVNDATQIKRIYELIQKTNQFNLTTLRLTEEQVRGAMCYPLRTYTLSAKDRFGDNGLTGVCIIRGNCIDVFLLSCRILGRGIEYAFMDYIIADLKKEGYSGIIGRYIGSPKNAQVKSFYSTCGFECLTVSENGVHFSINFENYKNLSKKHFQYE